MPAPKTPRLTFALRQQIVASIRGGGFPHVAAQAFGVPSSVLEDWLERGRRPNAREPYRSFARELDQARSQARLRAELDVLEKEPKRWLEHGPGRDRSDDAGWSTPVKPVLGGAAARNPLLDPEVRGLINLLVELLKPFPDARRHVVAGLEDRGLLMAA